MTPAEVGRGVAEAVAPIAARSPRPDLEIDADALADHLYTTFEGAFILCRTIEDPSAMRAQLRVLRQLVESLLRLD